jgi:molybdopterin-guanine dinucleotide biosynthesis protein A
MSKPYGLVVAGGQSSRMGVDKGLLNYNGQPQRYHIYDMLVEVCGEAYISCNKEQAASIPPKYNIIIDAPEYEGIGPMGGILSAFKAHPIRSFLAIGCDYPSLTERHLLLLYNKLVLGYTVSFFNTGSNLYEPLLSGYQYDIACQLKQQFRNLDYSLQSFFRCTNVQKIEMSCADIPKSIDTPEEALKWNQ